MQLEHFVHFPDCPGMEEAYSIVPENIRMNPNCPCETRTCPHHGFCAMCVQHHKDIDTLLEADGKPGHGTMCDRIRARKKAEQEKGGAFDAS